MIRRDARGRKAAGGHTPQHRGGKHHKGGNSTWGNPHASTVCVYIYIHNTLTHTHTHTERYVHGGSEPFGHPRRVGPAYIYLSIYLHTHTHIIYIYIYIYIYMYMYIHIYIYIYICIYIRRGRRPCPAPPLRLSGRVSVHPPLNRRELGITLCVGGRPACQPACLSAWSRGLAFTRYSLSSRPLYENQYYYSQTSPLFGHPPPASPTLFHNSVFASRPSFIAMHATQYW